jgi:hypothetical protein
LKLQTEDNIYKNVNKINQMKQSNEMKNKQASRDKEMKDIIAIISDSHPQFKDNKQNYEDLLPNPIDDNHLSHVNYISLNL